MPVTQTARSEHSLRAHVAARVRAARGWANYSQPELAEALGMSVASIRRVEQEKRDISTPELLHIAEVCSVPRNFMLYGFTAKGKSRDQSKFDSYDGIIEDLTRRLERHEKLHNLIHDELFHMRSGELNPDLVAEFEAGLSDRPNVGQRVR